MGRYSDDINAAETLAVNNQRIWAQIEADALAKWNAQAAPLKVLLERLAELQEDLRDRNIGVLISDKTIYPIENEYRPSVAFQLKKPGAYPPRETARFQAIWSVDRYQITAEETSGPNEGRVSNIRDCLLLENDVDELIRRAITEYPWFVREEF